MSHAESARCFTSLFLQFSAKAMHFVITAPLLIQLKQVNSLETPKAEAEDMHMSESFQNFCIKSLHQNFTCKNLCNYLTITN
jgi:hypothetical protein